MRVLFVSKPMNNPERLINVHPRLRCMPNTKLIWARTNKAIEENIGKVDVVFLNMVKETRWVSRYSPIYGSSVFTTRFFGDVWKLPKLRAKYSRYVGCSLPDIFKDYNLRVTPTNWLFKKNCPEWISSMFWSPHCISVQGYRTQRDIDVLFWGRADGVAGYRTRAKIKALLRSCITAEKIIDDSLCECNLTLNGRRYKFMLLEPREYRGERLYELISRTKVCCIAPPDCSFPGGGFVGAPVGKFFENAACGAVSLTTDFSDRKALGFEHGKNIWITTLDHYLRDLSYLLTNPNLIDEISKNTKELIRTRHTPEIRGKELYEFLKGKTGVV